MRHSFALLIIILLVAVIMPHGLVSQARPPGPPTPRPARLGAASNPALPHAQDHVLVKLRPGVLPAPGMRHVLGRWYRAPVPQGETPWQAVDAWLQQSGVELVQLDYIVQVERPQQMAGPVNRQGSALTPNDPLYGDQWNFERIQVPTAWEINTGAGVVVAVVDSGVSKGSDLACRTFVDEYNVLNWQQGPGAAADDYGHGTHVAGTIAQCTNNGIGVAGIAYDVQLMPIKALNSQGKGGFSDIAAGIDWARGHGADVINLSLGGPCYSDWPQCSDSLMNEAIEAAAAEDIVIMGAAGNFRQSKVAMPANHPDIIAVAATNYFNGHPPYSNQGSALSITAPGGDLGEDIDGDGVADRIAILQQTIVHGAWGYYYLDGTSMATAHASAAAAMLRSMAPTATRQQIQQILEASALDLGVEGFDTTYGWGLIQIADALQLIASQFPTATPGPTATSTPTPTSTPSPTISPTPTLTASPSPTPTSSPTPSPTATSTPRLDVHLWLPLLWQTFSPLMITPSPTPTATVTVTPACRELLLDGGFEGTDGWTIVATNLPARYVQQPVHGGGSAMLLGQQPPAAARGQAEATPAAVEARSAVFQRLILPDTATDLRLSFWYWPGSLMASGDWQRVLVTDGRSLAVKAEVLNTQQDNETWLPVVFDLTRFAGQDVAIYFEVNNHDIEDGLPTWMFVDDVSVLACD